MARREIEAYVGAVFRNGEGYAHLALGQDPAFIDGTYEFGRFERHYFRWPEERGEMVNFLLEARGRGDVYLCPYLMRGARRRKGESVARWCIHADVDGVNTMHVINAANDLGGFVMASGSRDCYHVYVPLDRSVSPTEHRALCAALRDRLGGDDKIADNDLLRPPGTLNHKAVARGGDDPSMVQFAVRPPLPERWSSPAVIADQLGVDLSRAGEGASRARAGEGRAELSADTKQTPESTGGVPAELLIRCLFDDSHMFRSLAEDNSAGARLTLAEALESGRSFFGRVKEDVLAVDYERRRTSGRPTPSPAPAP